MSDLLEVKDVATAMPLRTGNGINNSARLVALGNAQDRSEHTKRRLSSPTPSTAVALLQATVAAAKNRAVKTFDVGQAFLNSRMSEDEANMALEKEGAEALIKVNPARQQLLREDGAMVVELKKALYGVVEAPRLRRDALSACLCKLRSAKE